MKKFEVLLLDKMPWEQQHQIRLCIPGIDKGSAVWLETVCGDDIHEAQKLRSKIEEALS